MQTVGSHAPVKGDNPLNVTRQKAGVAGQGQGITSWIVNPHQVILEKTADPRDRQITAQTHMVIQVTTEPPTDIFEKKLVKIDKITKRLILTMTAK